MQLEKTTIVKEEWVIKHGGIVVPLEAIKITILAFLLFAIMAAGINTGYANSYSEIATNAYITGQLYVPGGNTMHCWMQLNMENHVQTFCQAQNGTAGVLNQTWIDQLLKANQTFNTGYQPAEK